MLIVLLVTGLSSHWLDLGDFWRSYLLDMTGPPWAYILLRGRFTAWADNRWTRFFTPTRTLLIVVTACFAIEGAQFLGVYDATFDPFDLLAYVSLLGPVFLVDLRASRRAAATA